MSKNAKCKDNTLAIGVDLNRNFAVNFGEVDKNPDTLYATNDEEETSDPCNPYYPGPTPFSEPETQAYKAFLTKHKDELAFIINMHSYGNAFIWPFNGVRKNDIEERRPGMESIFSELKDQAAWPIGELFGTSRQTMGRTIGGDQDDWALAELGIPSVTDEIGNFGQYSSDLVAGKDGAWVVKDIETAQDIMNEQSNFIDYVFEHLPDFAEIKQDSLNSHK